MQGQSKWHVYILVCEDQSFYTGISQDVTQRFLDHRLKRGALYTKGKRPQKVCWTESHDDISSARRREKQIKGWTRKKKIALIKGQLSLLKTL